MAFLVCLGGSMTKDFLIGLIFFILLATPIAFIGYEATHNWIDTIDVTVKITLMLIAFIILFLLLGSLVREWFD